LNRFAVTARRQRAFGRRSAQHPMATPTIERSKKDRWH
jgi:hypothetical protein